MISQSMMKCYRRMADGDAEAREELARYLQKYVGLARAGDKEAAEHLASLMNALVYDIAPAIMRAHFPYLVQRGYSVAMVVSTLWERRRKIGILPEDPQEIQPFVRIRTWWILLEFARKQRRLDARHPSLEGGPESDSVASRHTHDVAIDPNGQTPSSVIVQEEEQELLAAQEKQLPAAVASLPEEMRVVVELTSWKGMSRRAVAEALGLTQHRVRKNLQCALLLLRQALQAD